MTSARTTDAYRRPSKNYANYLATTPEHGLDSSLGVLVKDIDHSLLELSSRNLLHEELVQLCWTPILGFGEPEVGPEGAEESTTSPEESGSPSPCFVSFSHKG
jgi:hypothetical protein